MIPLRDIVVALERAAGEIAKKDPRLIDARDLEDLREVVDVLGRERLRLTLGSPDVAALIEKVKRSPLTQIAIDYARDAGPIVVLPDPEAKKKSP